MKGQFSRLCSPDLLYFIVTIDGLRLPVIETSSKITKYSPNQGAIQGHQYYPSPLLFDIL